MGRRHTNWMTANVWTPTTKSELAGTPDGIILLAFYALTTPERRAKVIAELQRIDMTMTEHENLKDKP